MPLTDFMKLLDFKNIFIIIGKIMISSFIWFIVCLFMMYLVVKLLGGK
jgi:hypothetical protein